MDKAGLRMSNRKDARAEELDNLRIALATFALQLDAFEMRASDALLAVRQEPSIPIPRTLGSLNFKGGK
jgi:hypothetical protein